MKKTLNAFKNMLPEDFTYISGFTNGMRSKVKIKNNITGKIHNIIAENYVYLNSNSGMISERMVIEECNKRDYKFIRKDNNLLYIDYNGTEYSVYLYNFMRGMDPKEISVIKTSLKKIAQSKKNFIKKSIRNDINDYEIVEFSGMKKSMVVRHIPTDTIIDISSPQIFSKGGYTDFPWDQEKRRCILENAFLEKFNNIEDIDKYSLADNFKYYNNKTKIKIIHQECGKTFDVRPDFFINQGTRCPYCALKGKSSQEIEVLDYVKSIYPGKIEHSYKLIDNTEIDIYLPDFKIGIEYNGLYWHSEVNGRDKKYHLDKTEKCNDHNIRLIHIFEDEWVNKKEIVKSKILHILGLNNRPKIYARKCVIKEIDSKMKNIFLNNNHIQGEDKSSIRLGLFYETKLVSVMTFSKPRGGIGKNTGKKGMYELVRFASVQDSLVIGGFGKMLKYFIRNYDFNTIRTYADLRWSEESNIYEKNDFKLIWKSDPNYWYADRYCRYHRYNFRKQLLKNKFPDLYDSSLTEFEIMDQTTYNRIWDCGNLVYELENIQS